MAIKSVTKNEFAQVCDETDACELVRGFLRKLVNTDEQAPIIRVYHDNATLGGFRSRGNFLARINHEILTDSDIQKGGLEQDALHEAMNSNLADIRRADYLGTMKYPTALGAMCQYRSDIKCMKLLGYPLPEDVHYSVKKEWFNQLMDDCLNTEIGSIAQVSGKDMESPQLQDITQFTEAMKGFFIEELDLKMMLNVMQHTLESGGGYSGEQENVRPLRNSCIRICAQAIERLPTPHLEKKNAQAF